MGELLEKWYEKQQELNSQLLSNLNLLSRDKYHKKSFIYEFEPEIELEIDSETNELEVKTASKKEVTKTKGTSFSNKLHSKPGFEELINTVIEVANSKIKLQNSLEKS